MDESDQNLKPENLPEPVENSLGQVPQEAQAPIRTQPELKMEELPKPYPEVSIEKVGPKPKNSTTIILYAGIILLVISVLVAGISFFIK